MVFLSPPLWLTSIFFFSLICFRYLQPKTILTLSECTTGIPAIVLGHSSAMFVARAFLPYLEMPSSVKVSFSSFKKQRSQGRARHEGSPTALVLQIQSKSLCEVNPAGGKRKHAGRDVLMSKNGGLDIRRWNYMVRRIEKSEIRSFLLF